MTRITFTRSAIDCKYINRLGLLLLALHLPALSHTAIAGRRRVMTSRGSFCDDNVATNFILDYICIVKAINYTIFDYLVISRL